MKKIRLFHGTSINNVDSIKNYQNKYKETNDKLSVLTIDFDDLKKHKDSLERNVQNLTEKSDNLSLLNENLTLKVNKQNNEINLLKSQITSVKEN